NEEEYEYENNNGGQENAPNFIGNLQNYLVSNTHRNNLAALLNRESIGVNYEIGRETLLEIAIDSNQIEIVKLLLERGASLRKVSTLVQTSIGILSLFIGSPVINSLALKNELLRQICIKGEPQHLDRFRAAYPDIDILSQGIQPIVWSGRNPDMVLKLIALGVNPNGTVHGIPYIHWLAGQNNGNTLEVVLKLRKVDKDVSSTVISNGRLATLNLEDRARRGDFTPEVNEVILTHGIVPWYGLSRGDVEHYENMLKLETYAPLPALPGQAAEPDSPEIRDRKRVETLTKLTICPICITNVEHTGGCMYMGVSEAQKHDCKQLGVRYHRDLYQKYRNIDSPGLYFCMYCSRICIGHRHYVPNMAAEPQAEMYTAANYGEIDGSAFAPSCATVNHGGGGMGEKIIRIQAYLQKAAELQPQAGHISAQRAKEQLIEAFWNAPMVVSNTYGDAQTHDTYHLNMDVRTQYAQGILQNQTFGVDLAQFPVVAGPLDDGEEEIPELAKPAVDDGLLPVIADVPTENALNVQANLEAGIGIGLVHRDYRVGPPMVNEVRNHATLGEYVSKGSLATYIDGILTSQYSLN
ncbi:hypothetical protein EBU71_17045, partial [bacterium]|nr:hypothetical protein [Candidatus Elulimicrobium humile]